MFDPYHKWLGIAPKDQPPNHYRLLGIDLFESDSDVIDAAANRQMAYLQQRATGKHAAVSQKLLNEIAAARVCLLNRGKKAAYDAELKAKLAEADQGSPKPDLSELESSPAAPGQSVASVPVRPAPTKRSFRPTPWHYSVAIGVAGLLAIGAWAAFRTGSQSDQAIVRSGTKPQQDQAPPPAEDKEIADSVTAEPKPSESSNDPSGEKTSIEPAVAEPKPSESPSGLSKTKPDTWTPCIYRLTIEPSSANVDVKSTKAVVTGSGRQRTVSFDERPESLNVRVMVTCAGYEWKQEWLTPESGKVQYITVSLTKSQETTIGEKGIGEASVQKQTIKNDVNLLRLVEPQKHTIRGTWRFDGTRLVSKSPKDGPSVILVPYHPSGEYDMQIVARNPGSGGAFIVGFVYGHAQSAAFLDVGNSSHFMGLETSQQNRTYRAVSFFDGQRASSIRCKVKSNGVVVTNFSGDRIEWQGNYRSFGDKPLYWADIPDKRALFLATWGDFEISEMTLVLQR